MKIQFISHIPGHYSEKRKAHLHFIPYYLEKLGHKIDIIEKKHWLRFYLRYLKFKPDVLIVSGIIGYFPVLFKRLHLIRKPIIYYWGDYFHEAMGAKWGIARTAYMEFYCAQHADFITTPSIFLKTVCDLFKLKSEYVPHGVIPDLQKIKPINLSTSNTSFAYIGDIDHYKKVDRIIDAVKNKDCTLYLIGKCFDESIIKDMPKNIIYLGELSHEKTLSYVKACDIAVLTADQDSALKMFEYLSLGKPILAFNGRINYVLTHLKNAYLSSDFSEGVDVLIKNQALRKQLAKNASLFKVDTWDKVAKKYEDIMKNLVKK